MRALLRGGPVDGRTIDNVAASTENINIPATTLDPKYAHYRRVGELGNVALFDFVTVYPGSGITNA
jgi:hypothetical protein